MRTRGPQGVRERVIELFQEGRYRGAEIARMVGVSRERVRQIVDEEFYEGALRAYGYRITHRRKVLRRWKALLRTLPQPLRRVLSRYEVVSFLPHCQKRFKLDNGKAVCVRTTRRVINFRGSTMYEFNLQDFSPVEDEVCVFCVPNAVFVVPSEAVRPYRYLTISTDLKYPVWLRKYRERWDLLE